MTTYLGQLDEYVYTKIYKYLWDDVMKSIINDYSHVVVFTDTFYSAGCQHKLYAHINDEYLTKRLFMFYITQIRNGKLRRGSDRIKEIFHTNLVRLNQLTVYNNSQIHLTPLYQAQFGTLFQKRNDEQPPIVGYLIRILLTIKVYV
jgi:hypothetical protein